MQRRACKRKIPRWLHHNYNEYYQQLWLDDYDQHNKRGLTQSAFEYHFFPTRHQQKDSIVSLPVSRRFKAVNGNEHSPVYKNMYQALCWLREFKGVDIDRCDIQGGYVARIRRSQLDQLEQLPNDIGPPWPLALLFEDTRQRLLDELSSNNNMSSLWSKCRNHTDSTNDR